MFSKAIKEAEAALKDKTPFRYTPNWKLPDMNNLSDVGKAYLKQEYDNNLNKKYYSLSFFLFSYIGNSNLKRKWINISNRYGVSINVFGMTEHSGLDYSINNDYNQTDLEIAVEVLKKIRDDYLKEILNRSSYDPDKPFYDQFIESYPKWHKRFDKKELDLILQGKFNWNDCSVERIQNKIHSLMCYQSEYVKYIDSKQHCGYFESPDGLYVRIYGIFGENDDRYYIHVPKPQYFKTHFGDCISKLKFDSDNLRGCFSNTIPENAKPISEGDFINEYHAIWDGFIEEVKSGFPSIREYIE